MYLVSAQNCLYKTQAFIMRSQAEKKYIFETQALDMRREITSSRGNDFAIVNLALNMHPCFFSIVTFFLLFEHS